MLLPASLLEQVEAHRSDYAIVQEWLTQFQLIVDSLEQARERPGDHDEQRSYFSGKKQQHTFKSQIVTLPAGKDIVDATAGAKGPTSDISVFRERQSKFAPEQGFDGDKAYVGAENVQTPHKKPRGKALTPQQKAENKNFSSTRRIFVEHVIRLLRIFRVTKERFRLHPHSLWASEMAIRHDCLPQLKNAPEIHKSHRHVEQTPLCCSGGVGLPCA